MTYLTLTSSSIFFLRNLSIMIKDKPERVKQQSA